MALEEEKKRRGTMTWAEIEAEHVRKSGRKLKLDLESLHG